MMTHLELVKDALVVELGISPSTLAPCETIRDCVYLAYGVRQYKEGITAMHDTANHTTDRNVDEWQDEAHEEIFSTLQSSPLEQIAEVK